ncbi:basic leucine zipper 19 isoform X1 [Iris pallida]|uniref:Basic leucine zipper 19 isoform X1 n=1 Tax=Iris pallida TaxID=29817 RepID=A0AAX6E4X0_IRIPA|nr:basic leucine zipper 19 isoform X1 [Iris pallida]
MWLWSTLIKMRRANPIRGGDFMLQRVIWIRRRHPEGIRGNDLGFVSFNILLN